MKIGALNITWGTKDKIDMKRNIELINTLSIYKHGLNTVLASIDENKKDIQEIKSEMRKLKNTIPTIKSIGDNEDLKIKIIDLLKEKSYSAQELRIKLKKGSNRVYKALDELQKKGLIVKSTQGRRVFYKIQ